MPAPAACSPVRRRAPPTDVLDVELAEAGLIALHACDVPSDVVPDGDDGEVKPGQASSAAAREAREAASTPRCGDAGAASSVGAVGAVDAVDAVDAGAMGAVRGATTLDPGRAGVASSVGAVGVWPAMAPMGESPRRARRRGVLASVALPLRGWPPDESDAPPPLLACPAICHLPSASLCVKQAGGTQSGRATCAQGLPANARTGSSHMGEMPAERLARQRREEEAQRRELQWQWPWPWPGPRTTLFCCSRTTAATTATITRPRQQGFLCSKSSSSKPVARQGRALRLRDRRALQAHCRDPPPHVQYSTGEARGSAEQLRIPVAIWLNTTPRPRRQCARPPLHPHPPRRPRLCLRLLPSCPHLQLVRARHEEW
jgi:hypothetical protein